MKNGATMLATVALAAGLVGCRQMGNLASKERLPSETLGVASLLTTPRDVETVIKPETPSNSSSALANAADRAETMAHLSADAGSALEPAQRGTPSNQYAMPATADTRSSAGTNSARDLARRIQRQMPGRLEEYLQDVRKAATQGTLSEVVESWELVLEFGGPSPSRSVESLSAAFLDRPARQERLVQYRPQETEADEYPPELPRRSPADVDPYPPELPDAASELEPSIASRPRRLPFREESSSSVEDGTKLPGQVPVARPSQEPPYDALTSAGSLAEKMEDLANRDLPNRTRWLVASRLLSAVEGDAESALEPIDTVAPAERRFWKNYTYAILRYVGHPSSSRIGQRAGEAADAVREAMGALSEQADLEITEPRFCRSVQSFGNFEEFPTDDFRPGDPVVVYWEVRHFASVETEQGFKTSMLAEFEILDSLGTRRHQFRQKFKDDVCRQRRSDYFNVVLFEWPKNLTSGEYTLKVTVTDSTSQKTCERQRRFRVVGDRGSGVGDKTGY